MSLPTNPQSIFPDLPREVPVINKEGDFSPLWSLGISALFQALQVNFKNEGVIFPNLSAANIADIQSLYAGFIGMPLPQYLIDISGQTVFDTDNRVSKQFVITYDGASPPNILAAQWNILPYLVFGMGNPNGAQAGQISWMYYDVTNKILYICTTSGSTVSAVWTSI